MPNISDKKGQIEHQHLQSKIYERKAKVVTLMTTATMIAEIIFGYITNSMALLADGWHMSSHAFAIGLTWVAYIIARKYAQTDKYSFSKEKLLALAGFTSALVLQIVAIIIIIQAMGRLISPLPIKFSDALIVAIIGLIVNGISAFVLHHKQEYSDLNIKAAYYHVLADGLTSITAIIALLAGMLYNLYSLDAVSGIISSFVITKWAVKLIKDSGKELIGLKKRNII